MGDIRVLYMEITSVNLSSPPGAGFTWVQTCGAWTVQRSHRARFF